MSDRDRLVDEKSKSIQETLKKWAEEQDFLKPGEQLVFTLEIQNIKLVTRARRQSVDLDMLVFDYFDHNRLAEAGVPSNVALRMHNAIRNYAYNPIAGEPWDYSTTTVHEYLKIFSTWAVWARIPNFGRVCRNNLGFLFHEAGIALK